MTTAAETPRGFCHCLLLGRFQMLHAGHEDMIRKALACADEAWIFVGSAQEAGTEKNPFSYELRKEMIERVFPDRVIVKPLPDAGIGNNSRWGDYVLEHARTDFGDLPDLVISGKESRRNSWYDGEAGESIAELFIPKIVRISATEMREMMLEDREEEWKKLASPALHDMYPVLREALLMARGNAETMSI